MSLSSTDLPASVQDPEETNSPKRKATDPVEQSSSQAPLSPFPPPVEPTSPHQSESLSGKKQRTEIEVVTSANVEAQIMHLKKEVEKTLMLLSTLAKQPNTMMERSIKQNLHAQLIVTLVEMGEKLDGVSDFDDPLTRVCYESAVRSMKDAHLLAANVVAKDCERIKLNPVVDISIVAE